MHPQWTECVPYRMWIRQNDRLPLCTSFRRNFISSRGRTHIVGITRSLLTTGSKRGQFIFAIASNERRKQNWFCFEFFGDCVLNYGHIGFWRHSKPSIWVRQVGNPQNSGIDQEEASVPSNRPKPVAYVGYCVNLYFDQFCWQVRNYLSRKMVSFMLMSWVFV